jgi:hypothetical protein
MLSNNRRERRKIAKDLGLFSKDVPKSEKEEQYQILKDIGKMKNLRNLTEQRNLNKNNNTI